MKQGIKKALAWLMVAMLLLSMTAVAAETPSGKFMLPSVQTPDETPVGEVPNTGDDNTADPDAGDGNDVIDGDENEVDSDAVEEPEEDPEEGPEEEVVEVPTGMLTIQNALGAKATFTVSISSWNEESELPTKYTAYIAGVSSSLSLDEDGKLTFELDGDKLATVVLPYETNYIVEVEAPEGVFPYWEDTYGYKFSTLTPSGSIYDGSNDVLICRDELESMEKGSLYINAQTRMAMPSGYPYGQESDEMDSSKKFIFTVTLGREDDLPLLTGYEVLVYRGYHSNPSLETIPCKDGVLTFELGIYDAIDIEVPYGTYYTLDVTLVSGFEATWYEYSPNTGYSYSKITGSPEGTIDSWNRYADYDCYIGPDADTTGTLTIARVFDASSLVDSYSLADANTPAAISANNAPESQKVTFHVKLTPSSKGKLLSNYTAIISSAFGGAPTTVDLPCVGGELTFELDYYEAVTVLLPYGIKYEVTADVDDTSFDTKWIDAYSYGPYEAMDGNPSGTLSADDPEAVYIFASEPKEGTGMLIIANELVMARTYSTISSSSLAVPEGLTFDFTVTLSCDDEQSLEDEYTVMRMSELDGGITTMTVQQVDSKLTFKLGLYDQVAIMLPYGTSYVISRESNYNFVESAWYQADEDGNYDDESGARISDNPQGTIEETNPLDVFVCANVVIDMGTLSLSKVDGTGSKKPLPPPVPIYPPVYKPPVYSYSLVGAETPIAAVPGTDAAADTEKTAATATGEDEDEEDGPFTFTITLTSEDDQPLTGDYLVTFDGYTTEILHVNSASFDVELGFGDVFMMMLPFGTKYTIEEAEYDGYTAIWRAYDDQEIDGRKITGTIEYSYTSVTCVNTPTPTEGTLSIYKGVNGNLNGPFTFTLDLKLPDDADLSIIYLNYYYSGYYGKEHWVVPAEIGDSGEITFDLNKSQWVEIDLPVGTEFTVTEEGDPHYYTTEWNVYDGNATPDPEDRQTISGIISEEASYADLECWNTVVDVGYLAITKTDSTTNMHNPESSGFPYYWYGNYDLPMTMTGGIATMSLLETNPEEFTFTVKLEAPNGQDLWDTYCLEYYNYNSYYGTYFWNGEHKVVEIEGDTLTFKMSMGQSVRIRLPAGTTFTVTEQAANDTYYETSWRQRLGYNNYKDLSEQPITGTITTSHTAGSPYHLYCVNAMKTEIGTLSISKKTSYTGKPKPNWPPVNPAPTPTYSTATAALPLMVAAGTQAVEDTLNRFTFTVTVTDESGDPLSGNYIVEINGKREIWKFSDGTFDVTLGFDETFKIYLPYGTKYTVEEKENAIYDATWYKNGCTYEGGSRVTGTIDAYWDEYGRDQDVQLICVNEISAKYGFVTISKTKGQLTGELPPVPVYSLASAEVPQATEGGPFTFTVTLDTHGDPLTECYVAYNAYWEPYTFEKIDVNGNSFTFELDFGDSIMLLLPIGTDYTIKETEDLIYGATWYGDWYGQEVDGYVGQSVSGTVTEDNNNIYWTCENGLKAGYGSLMIAKTATNYTSRRDKFTFTITLTPAEGQELLEEYYAAYNVSSSYYYTPTFQKVTPSEDGTITVKLTFNENFVILLPEGTTYTVEETENYYYETSWDNVAGDSTISEDGKTVSGVINSEDNRFVKANCYNDEYEMGSLFISKSDVGPETSGPEISGRKPKPETSGPRPSTVIDPTLHVPGSDDISSTKEETWDESDSESVKKAASKTFTFEVKLTAPKGQKLRDVYVVYYYDVRNNFLESKFVAPVNGKLTIEVGMYRTIRIDLPVGTKYTVKEVSNAGYNETWYKDKKKVGGKSVTGTITEKNEQVWLHCKNTPAKPNTPAPTVTPVPTPEPTPTLEPTPTPEPQFVDVSGRKTWDDNNNADGLRPKSIVVRLLQNGVVIQQLTVTAQDGWKYSFTNLPERDEDNNPYVYTVSEQVIPGYFARVNGYDITNIRIKEPPVPKTPKDRMKELTVEELSDLIMLFDYGTPLWGGLLQTGDELPVYPFVFGGIGVIALAAYLVLSRKKKANS